MSRRWDGYLAEEPTGKVAWYELEVDRPKPLKWMDRLCGHPCGECHGGRTLAGFLGTEPGVPA